MEVYLVGGAVRDELLGRAVKERDWVVVGATAEDMQRQGMQQVGRDFPVFLHPRDPRGVRARAHRAQDRSRLSRIQHRRLTGRNPRTGSRAPRPDHQRHGALDRRSTHRSVWRAAAICKARQLRHVSPAFPEDPLRVLRVARFAARFAALNFRVADETLALMRQMSS